jgi:hypothetical protein
MHQNNEMNYIKNILMSLKYFSAIFYEHKKVNYFKLIGGKSHHGKFTSILCCDISGSHGSKHEHDSLLGYNAMWSH